MVSFTRQVAKACVLVLLIGTNGVFAAGAESELVLDIAKTRALSVEEVYLNGADAVVVDSVAYFLNDDGVHGRELWRSDGTDSGTRIVEDLCPGSCGTLATSRHQIVGLGDRVLFAAEDGVHGTELWAVSSGASPQLLLDAWPGWRSGSPRQLTRAASRAYFVAQRGPNQHVLWSTDGTPSGTVAIRTYDHPLPFEAERAGTLGENLLFADSDGLWMSDGSPLGTVQVSPVHAAGAAFISAFGAVYFGGYVGPDVSSGMLWRSDGTLGGTVPIEGTILPARIVPSPTSLFFASESDRTRIWKLEPSSGVLSSASLPQGSVWSGTTGQWATIDQRLLFLADDALHGQELWTSDGATAELIRDIRPGPDSSILRDFENPLFGNSTFLVVLAGRALFFADDGTHGTELWRSNGQQSGTKRVQGSESALAGAVLDSWQGTSEPVRLDGRLLFQTRADDGFRHLWSTDGTRDSTRKIAILNDQASTFLPRAEGSGIFENPRVASCFTPLRNSLLFRPGGPEPDSGAWWSDGTDSGTMPIANPGDTEIPWLGYTCRALAGVGLLTSDGPDNGGRVFGTDGPGILELLAETAGFPGDLEAWTLVEDGWVFAAGDLWFTDGTTSGTSILAPEIPPFSPYESERAGNRLFVSSVTLWALDGKGQLTNLIDHEESDPPYPVRLTEFGETILFFATRNGSGQELWSSDGNASGTAVVRDIRSGNDSGIVESAYGGGRPLLSEILLLSHGAIFAADGGDFGEELWVTDGTTGGTRQLLDLFPGSYPSVPRGLVRTGDVAYFVAEAPAVGRELWVTDGTAEGTELVIDLVPGPDSSVPEHLTAAGSELYFSAWTPERGREAWRVRHGAEPLVAPLPEIAPGPLSSSPEIFVEIGGSVFTVANDNVRGFELWKLREEDVVFSDGFEGTTVEVWSTAVE